MANYVHDDLNNRIESLSKEEIYALLAAAIQEGQLPSVDEDTAFVTMIKSTVDGKAYKQAYCTQAQYNELVAADELEPNTVYFITDDTSYYDLVNAINNLQLLVTQTQNQADAAINFITGINIDRSNLITSRTYDDDTLEYKAPIDIRGLYVIGVKVGIYKRTVLISVTDPTQSFTADLNLALSVYSNGDGFIYFVTDTTNGNRMTECRLILKY